MKRFFTGFCLLLSSQVFAHDIFSTSISREWSDIGDIVSINSNFKFVDERTQFGFQLSTGLSAASVMDRFGYVEDYVAWEGSVKLGLFSDVSLYIEAGVDMGEWLFGYDEHDEYYHSHDEHYDEVDTFFGGGLGFKKDHVSINIFSRYRYIDGYNLHDTEDWYNGVELAISF